MVGEGRRLDAALAEHFVKSLGIGRVVGNGGIGVFEQMARQHTDDALVRANDALATQLPGAGDTGSAGRLAANATRTDLGLGIQYFLIGYLAHHTVADFQRAGTCGD